MANQIYAVPIRVLWFESSGLAASNQEIVERARNFRKRAIESFCAVVSVKGVRAFHYYTIEKVPSRLSTPLREYSTTNPDTVLAFISENNLPSLPRREDLKWLRKKGIKKE